MRNFNVDLLRIIFAVIIVYAHMGVMRMVPAIAVGPAVVFFFILTGYFTMNGIEKRKERGETIGKFLLTKLMSFLPYLLAASIVTFVLQTILQIDYYGYDVGESLISSLMTFFGDVSCLSMFGMPFIMGNVAVWYLSGMMVGLMITYPLVLKYGHPFSKYVAPVIGIMCLAACLRYTGMLFGPHEEVWGMVKGLLESVGSLCLGYFVFECVERFKAVNLTSFGRHLMSFIELGCYVLSIVMMFSWSQVNTGHIEGHLPQAWYEMAIIFMMVVASALTLSGRTSLAFDVSERPLLKRLSTFLATSSLVLYLSNYYQIYYVSKMMKQLSLEEKTMYIIVFVTVSFAIAYIGGKLLLRLGRRLRSMIVEDAVCSG